MNFVSSSKPSTANPSTNTNDFFYNVLMDSTYNRVDNSISGGELDDNTRVANSSSIGAQNRSFDNGILGSYFFTLANNTPEGTYNCGLHSVYFYDTDGTPYKLSSSNLNINNQSFQITPEPATLGLLALGGSLIGLNGIRKRKAERRAKLL